MQWHGTTRSPNQLKTAIASNGGEQHHTTARLSTPDESFPEMRDACVGELKVAGAHLFRCVHCARAAPLWTCHGKKAFLSPWTGCDNEGVGM